MNNYHSIPAMMLAGAEKWASRYAIVDCESRLTYQQTADLMIQVASSLRVLGIEPGDRVALWAPNSIIWVPVALGIQAAGARLVPLNTRLKAEEAAYILDKTRAKALFAVDEFLGVNYLDMLSSESTSLPALKSRLQIPGPGKLRSPEWESFLKLGEEVNRQEIIDSIHAIKPEYISDVLFTSGTTGKPKGVMLRHNASLAGYRIYNRTFELREGSHYMITVPFFHCFGYKAGWMLCLMEGATIFPVAVFDGRKALELVSTQGITHMAGTPTMFIAMLDDPERQNFNLETLETAGIAASTIPESLIHRVRDELGIPGTVSGYGLTENHGFVTLASRHDAPSVLATTVGAIDPDIPARVVNDAGEDVPSGEEGELILGGELVMDGYFEDEAATAATVIDGWLYTGDIVRLDENRYLKIIDRKKDIYIMGGFNVAPAEVEQVIGKIPGVAQVAVVGAPDEHFGEVGAAFIVREPDSALASDDVIGYCKTHLSNYKVPRYVEFVNSYPLNSTGKILKRELRDRIAAIL